MMLSKVIGCIQWDLEITDIELLETTEDYEPRRIESIIEESKLE
jgi:hypothetical protein